MAVYNYNISNFQNQQVNPTILQREISINSLFTSIIDCITTDEDICKIFFTRTLESSEVTVLNTIVNAHKGFNIVKLSDTNILDKSYTDFITLATAKKLNIQYDQQSYTNTKGYCYYLFAFDGIIRYESIACLDTDVDDFELNHKATGNKPLEVKNSDGVTVTAQTFPEIPCVQNWKSFKLNVPAGVESFYDILVDREIKIQGGDYHIINKADIHEDDYIEFSVIDKDDVLGLFSLYGLTVGTDIIELSKFVRTYYCIKGEAALYNVVHTAFRVKRGLYFRLGYNSKGSTNIRMIFNLLSYVL